MEKIPSKIAFLKTHVFGFIVFCFSCQIYAMNVIIDIAEEEQRRVYVSPFDPVQKLNGFVGENYNYIYNNRILCQAFSFQFYTIRDGDVINVSIRTTHAKSIKRRKCPSLVSMVANGGTSRFFLMDRFLQMG